MADLAALLDKEASAEIEGILSEARARASEIVARAETEAESLLASRKRAVESQQQATLVRARSAAQLESSSLVLRAQHGAIEDVFADVEKRLDAIGNDPSWAKTLGALMEEAVTAAGGQAADIRAVVVNPADEEAALAAAKRLGLADKLIIDPQVKAGVRLDGASHVAIENTLHGRLASLRDELAAEVAQVLLSKDA